MRRIVVSERESEKSEEIRRIPRLLRSFCRFSAWLAFDGTANRGANSLSASLEERNCSADLARTAENSGAVQLLPVARICCPLAPIVCISWQDSLPACEEQVFAAQSEAHIGAISKARPVSSARAETCMVQIRTWREFFIDICFTLRCAMRAVNYCGVVLAVRVFGRPHSF